MTGGVLKVLDFGVAVVIDETTRHKKIDGFGSPLYASPECILGQSLDICSDIYSLGATFYHVLAGVPPFEGDTVEDVIKKHLNEYMIPLKKRNPMVFGRFVRYHRQNDGQKTQRALFKLPGSA